MKTGSTSLIMLMAVLFAGGMSRADLIGIRGTFGPEDLFSLFNLETGGETIFGPSGVGQLKSLEVSPVDGSVYGLSPDMSFFKIDISTGHASMIKNW